MLRRTSLAVAAIAVVGLVTGLAQATLVSQSTFNGSFESPALDSDTGQSINGGTSNDTIIPKWNVVCATYAYAGMNNPGDSLYAGAAYPNDIPGGYAEGQQSSYLHWGGGTWSSSISYLETTYDVCTIASGTDYTLTLAVGTPLNIGGNTANTKVTQASISILAGGTAVATITLNPADLPGQGAWTDVSVSLMRDVIAANGYAGQGLKIKLWAKVNAASRRRIDFDNLRLDVVPEPAALSVLGIGALGVLLRKRRRQ